MRVGLGIEVLERSLDALPLRLELGLIQGWGNGQGFSVESHDPGERVEK
jgi:hypothetical protein